MKRHPIKVALAGAVLGPAVLVACGTSGSDGSSATTVPVSSTAAGAGTDAASGTGSADGCQGDITPTSTGPVSLTDSFGRKVELAQPAKRVAVLEWQQIEDVLTLCVTPVAVADAEGYTTWDTAEPLPDGVADVGGRGEPNLDALFAATPDLVIIEAYAADDEIIGRLERYDVPVLATSGANTADPVKNMLDTFNLIATAVGREARADAVRAEFQASLEEAKRTVAGADVTTTDFVYFDGWIEGGNVALRPFGQGSLMGELGEALGLRNAWTGEVDPAYGLGQTDIEGMTAVGDATFFYTGTVDPAGDFVAELKKNAIWSALPAVAEGRAHAFGGPRSAEQVLDAFRDALTR
jgi:ABC-type Fe3+-hydroxamate transport system substrate-binding protein